MHCNAEELTAALLSTPARRGITIICEGGGITPPFLTQHSDYRSSPVVMLTLLIIKVVPTHKYY